MKEERLVVRISSDDRKQIEKAVIKYHKETGAKQSISGMIRYVLKNYLPGSKECVK